MKNNTMLIAAIAIASGFLAGSAAHAAGVCELSGGVVKGGLCFLPCENPGEVRVQQADGQLVCVPPGKAPAGGQAAGPATPVPPVAPVAKAGDDCLARGGVRLGAACFLPCQNANETRVQFANGALRCVVIAGSPGDIKAKKVFRGKIPS